MSYSFEFKAKTKADAVTQAVDAFSKAIEVQREAHDFDLSQERANAMARIDKLPEPGDGEVVYVNAYGSTMGLWQDGKMVQARGFENHLVIRVQNEAPAS
jgi:hypothetical protein